MIGQTISHYRITGKLGEGGMGVVYKAEDTRLERTVALKFLAAHLLNDTEAKQRFLREARAAASLSHANICTVHEIDEADGRTFIAMAFVEGESLEERIARGPLPIQDVLDTAQQIAKGLQAAHEKGIIHRDIKPANILLDANGHATIMDFGLARLTEATRLTQADSTVGTAAYMSPEQAEGSDVDQRGDIWALGCVLYEMVCGQRPFRGQYNVALLYEIINQQPEPLTGLRTGVPMELERITTKCLAKDPQDRYHSAEELIVDLRVQLRTQQSGDSVSRTQRATGEAAKPLSGLHEPVSAAPDAASPAAVRSLKRQRGLLLAAVLVLSLGVGLGSRLFGPETPPPAAVRKFTFIPSSNLSDPAISPDGRYIAYLAGAERTLWVQELAHHDPRLIEGTRGASYPFWSVDSGSIAFGMGNDLKRVAAGGGPLVTICRVPDQPFRGGSFSPDGDSIVFAGGGIGKLYEVPTRSGLPQVVMEDAENNESYAFPHFLPETQGRRLLLFVVIGAESSRIVLRDLESGVQQDLASGAWPTYSPSGHILYESTAGGSNLWALPFSLASATATGTPFSVAPKAWRPSVAADQTLVFLDDSAVTERQLVWRSRNGERTAVIGQPLTDMAFPALSRDDRFVAVQGTVDGNSDIWVYSLSRAVRNRITADSETDLIPAWSASGAELAFASHRNGNWDLWTKPVDGTGEASELVATSAAEGDAEWSADGRYLLFGRIDPATNRDIWYLKREPGTDQETAPFLQTQFDEGTPKFSPDGLYVAYVSNESGSDQVYVRPFSGGRRLQISLNGGGQPRWRRDGKELFFVSGDTLMAVPVRTEPEFAVGAPERLFSAEVLVGSFSPAYDVAGDGQRFVLSEPVQEGSNRVVRLVQNWFSEFGDRQR